MLRSPGPASIIVGRGFILQSKKLDWRAQARPGMQLTES